MALSFMAYSHALSRTYIVIALTLSGDYTIFHVCLLDVMFVSFEGVSVCR